MPIDTRDWYRDKPMRWTESPPPRRRSPARTDGNHGHRRLWVVLVLAFIAFVVVPYVLSQPKTDDPGVLPTSSMYFLKGIGRETRYAFTFDPLDKATLKLRFADQDALAIGSLYSSGDYLEAVQQSFTYQDNFFTSLAWTVKSHRQGCDVEAMMLDLKTAHHRHRLMFAQMLRTADDHYLEAFVGAIAYTTAPFQQVIGGLQSPTEAAQFSAEVEKDFASIGPDLWAEIELRLTFDMYEDLGVDSPPGADAAQVQPEPTSDGRPASEPDEEQDDTPDVAKVNGFDPRTGQYDCYYLGLVYTSDGVLSGGCYGPFVVLINNEGAVNPTYNELLSFLRDDATDKFRYRYESSLPGFFYGEAEDQLDAVYLTDIVDGRAQPLAPAICADFAERLHNNAEQAGIRAGYVSIDLSGYPDSAGYGIPSDSGHALNVFETTDRGTVFIDCTGGDGSGPYHQDMIIRTLQVGQAYIPDFLFESGGWYALSMGNVTEIEVTWDGEWRP